MLFTKPILLTAPLIASAAAYHGYHPDSDFSLQARALDSSSNSNSNHHLNLHTREASIEDDDGNDFLLHALAARSDNDLDEQQQQLNTLLLLRRAILELRGTTKRPNLGGNLRLTPGTIARANAAPVQQIPASHNAPQLPRVHGDSYFPAQGGGHGDAAAGSRRGSSDSMRSLFGSP